MSFTVTNKTRAAGEGALRRGCAELGIPVQSMRIQWLIPSAADSSGQQENTIYVNATLNPREAARTVIHELAHFAAARKYVPPRGRSNK